MMAMIAPTMATLKMETVMTTVEDVPLELLLVGVEVEFVKEVEVEIDVEEEEDEEEEPVSMFVVTTEETGAGIELDDV
ncbi:hypothetical protein HK100_001634 [Physocladia obscura]|uniref:Uncharacterized protein n=1 Tax=Physocladia obscura TaxID=109957 RepID=A0AAD5T8X0_9FUNG|nr:hypothetical protein HK100_001634 [Physocladia obscura]